MIKNLSQFALLIFVVAFTAQVSIAQCPDIDAPIINVIDNTCSPIADGSYNPGTCATGVLEYSIDNGATWNMTLPAYPMSFIARCLVAETCMMVEADFADLNGSIDAIGAVNSSMPPIMVGGAVLTLDVPVYNGNAVADEEEINPSQTTGAVGIKFGVDNAIGAANNMMNGYNLSEAVCNVSFIIWDIDQTDEMVLELSNGGTAVSYTVNPLDPMSCVTQTGNSFTTSATVGCQVQAPNTNLAVQHAVMITANDCIDAIDITYYDNASLNGNGGSYTISNIQGEACQEGCESPLATINPMPVVCEASIEIVKAPLNPDPNSPDGQTILTGGTAEFTITVTNTGNLTLNNVIVSDPNAPLCDRVIVSMAPDEIVTYNCSLENVMAGFINMAIVSGEPEGGGPEVMDDDPTSIIVLAPDISIMKSPSMGMMDTQTVPVGGTASFDIIVMNTGNVVLNNVEVADPLAPGCNMTIGQLLPGEEFTYTCTDSDFTGSYTNIASVSGEPDGGGDDVTEMDPSEVVVESSPSIDIIKTATDGTDSQTIPEGGTATFTITVNNTGDIDLNNVQVSDPLSPSCDMTFASIPVNGSESYTCTISNVTADFENIASVTGDPSDGSPTATDMDQSEIIVDICDLPAPELTITDKTCNPLVSGNIMISSECPVGSTLEYSLDGINWSSAEPVYNDNVALTIMTRCIEVGGGPEVCTAGSTADFSALDGSDDPIVAFLTADPPVMIDGATMTLGNNITMGSAFVDEEAINNTQTGADVGIRFGVQNSDGPSNNMMNFYNFSEPVCDLAVMLWDIDQTDVMILEAFNGATPVSYTTSNVGSCVNQSGTMFTPNGAACEIQINQDINHAFNVAFNDCVTQIKVTYYDSGAGSGGSYTISNFETLDCVSGDCISPVSTVVTAPEQCVAAISIVKSPADLDPSDSQEVPVGTPAEFSITVTNTGNITLNNVVVTDPASPGCDRNIGTLAPGVPFTYTCSSANVTAGFTNTASVVGEPEDGSMNVTGTDPSEVVVLTPAIDINKTATDGSDTQNVMIGETATFEITVTNTGSVDLTDVTVTDPLSPDCNNMIGNLAVGESIVYQCTLENVTTDFTNVASVVGTPVGGGPNVTGTDPSEVVVIVDAQISIVKSAADGTDIQEIPVGGTATFNIVVTNTGNITLNNVTVTDPLSPDCDNAIGTMTAGQVVAYTCTLVNVGAGFVNVASVTGDPVNGDPSVTGTDPSEVVVLIPAIDIVKSAIDGTDTQNVMVGESATFEITVTNSGMVDLTDVTVTDPLSQNCDNTIGALGVGESITYTCTIDNVTADFTNVASVVGTPVGGGPNVTSTDPSEVVVIVDAQISIVKSATDGTDIQEIPVGGTATFNIEVTNTGNITLNNVTVTDPLSPDCDNVIGTMTAGQVVTYTCTLVNVGAGFVNVASVTGDPVNGDPSVTGTDPSEVVVLIPAIDIVKSASDGTDSQQLDSGETAEFEITVTNTGQVVLNNVTITDPLAPACDMMVGTLAVGESFTYTCTLAGVTADLTNIATVTGTPEGGGPDLTDSDPSEVDVINPCISLTKSSTIALGPNGTGDAGDIVTYTYESCNCGDVTLTNVRVTETASLFTGTGILPVPGPTSPSTLAPGECGTATATYILTQADVNAEKLVNQAVTTGTPPLGPDQVDNSDTSNPNDPEETGGPDDPTTTPIPMICPALVCNDGLQISVGYECFVALTPDMLLEGSTGSGSMYTIQVFDENGINVGDTLKPAQIGQLLTYKVISECDENSCWGEILFESNILPSLNTVCDYVAGDMDMREGKISSSSDDPVKLTVSKSDDCQQMLFIESYAKLKYNSGTNVNPVWSLGTVSWQLLSGSTVVSSGDLTSEGDSEMIDISTLPSGEYMVVFTSNIANAIGDYKYKISVPSCEVDPLCVGWCGAGEPEAFVTLKEATEIINNGCGAAIVGDIQVSESESGDMCDPNGVIKVVTYTAVIEMHGEVSKVVLATQAYSQEKLDIRPGAGNTEILFPKNLEVDCDTDIKIDENLEFGSPAYIEALTGSGAAAYPSFIDIHSAVVPDTIFADKITHKDSIVGTREQMVQQEITYKDGTTSIEWVLLTVVDKVIIEVKEPDTIITGTFSRPLVPIRERLCNLLVTYDDLKFSACAGGEKIVREWVIIDWCDSSVRGTGFQNIEISDQTAPIVKTPSAKMVSTDPWTCSAKVRLPDLEIEDNCSSKFDVDWYSTEGTVVDGYAIDLWPSGDTIHFRGVVADECGNKTEVIMPIFVTDNVPPSMVCQDNLQVTLTYNPNSVDGDGVAKVYAESFDQGSHDSGCGEVKLTVVRMEDWTEAVTDCAGNVIGYKPQSCSPITQTVDLGGPSGKNDCIYDDKNLEEVTVAGDYVKFCCEDTGEDIMVMLIATDKNGNSNFCMVRVNVENKAVATMVCEPVTIECAGEMDDMPGPTMIGGACEGSIDIKLLDELNTNGNCGAGTIIRKYYVDVDGDGDVSAGDPYCEQIVTIKEGSGAFDPTTIKWPKHHDGTTVTGVNLECDPDAEDRDDPIETFTDVNVPMGDVAVCIPDDMGDSPSWCDTDCGLIGYNVNVDTVFVSDACLKIIKRWTIIDWCVWESNAEDIDDENDSANDTFEAVEDWAQGECVDCDTGHGPVHPDPVYFRYKTYDNDGYYTFDQIIKVVDDSAPTIDSPSEYTVNTSGGATTKDDETACTGSDAITVSAQDFCGGIASGSSKLSWVITITKNGELVTSKSETGATATMNTQTGSPGDVHVITWRVKDGCGNAATATTTVTFGDEKAPTPFCISGLTTAFMQDNGMIAVWGKEFDFGSFDNCTDSEDLRFSLVPDGQDPIRPGAEGFEDQIGITFNCNDFSNFQSLNVWVWDASGNGDFCNVGLVLGDNGDSCPEDNGQGNDGGGENTGGENTGGENTGASAMIAGQVTTESGEMINNTELTLNSILPEYPRSQMNGISDGSYAFENNVMGYDYSVRAKRDGDDANGVSTLDLVLISRHILSIKTLDSPYKIIAADANADLTLSTIDLVILKKLILGSIEDFPNTDSWVFLDKEFTFVQEMSPWPFMEMNMVLDLDRDMMQENFIGIKVGDVNGSGNANGLHKAEIRSNGTLTLGIEDKMVERGEEVTFDITAEDFNAYSGFQFTLNHSGLILKNIEKAALEVDENSIAVREERLTMSWFEDQAESHKGALFSLTFEATRDLRLSESLLINSSITKAEAYQGDAYDHHEIAIDFSEENVLVSELYQNSPNPFDESTDIGFSIPQTSKVSISILDITGKVVKEISETFTKGYHVVNVNRDDLNKGGVYYYQMDSGSFTATKKMILID